MTPVQQESAVYLKQKLDRFRLSDGPFESLGIVYEDDTVALESVINGVRHSVRVPVSTFARFFNKMVRTLEIHEDAIKG